MGRYVHFLVRGIVLTVCACFLGSGTSVAQFPERKIELVVPWAAGGGTDRTARLLAEAAKEYLGVSVYVTNRTGGAGVVGHHFVAQSAPNGYTLCMMTVEITTIAHIGIAQIYPDQFAPIIQVNFDPGAITVRADAPYNTIHEFIAEARRTHGGLRVGNSGPGAIWHLAAAGFAQEAGITLRYIPYDGASPAIRALLGGEIEAVSVSPGEVLPNVEGGKLKTLAVFSPERVPVMPDVPTVTEEGIPYTLGAWRGIAAPKGTPPEIVATLAAAFTKAFENARFQEIMRNNGFGLEYRNTEEFSAYMTAQYAHFGGIIKKLGLAPQ